ncbi:MAG: TldD/PmbA family protein, partial [Geminicoccaceae bacterium]
MSLDGPNFLGDLLAKAKQAGAESADAILVEQQGLSVTQRLGNLEKIERSENADLGLRVFVGRRQAIVSTGDLSKNSLERLVENGVAIAQSVPEDRFAGLAEAREIATDFPDLDLDDGVERGVQDLAVMAAQAEDIACAMPMITNSEGASAGWSRSRTMRGATNGFFGTSARSRHSLSASVIASDNGPMERDYEHVTKIRATDLPDPTEIGRAAAIKAARRVNPKKAMTKAVPVVFDPRVAGSVVQH